MPSRRGGGLSGVRMWGQGKKRLEKFEDSRWVSRESGGSDRRGTKEICSALETELMASLLSAGEVLRGRRHRIGVGYHRAFATGCQPDCPRKGPRLVRYICRKLAPWQQAYGAERVLAEKMSAPS